MGRPKRPGGAPTPPARTKGEAPMASSNGNARRSYGSGNLYIRTDAAGRESWHAQWRDKSGRRPRAVLGLVRQPGSREGITRTQANAELRRRMVETPATEPTS